MALTHRVCLLILTTGADKAPLHGMRRRERSDERRGNLRAARQCERRVRRGVCDAASGAGEWGAAAPVDSVPVRAVGSAPVRGGHGRRHGKRCDKSVSMVRRCVALLRRSGMTVSGASVSTSAVCWECVHDLVCNLSISLA